MKKEVRFALFGALYAHMEKARFPYLGTVVAEQKKRALSNLRALHSTWQT